MARKPTALDLFSGIGGLSEGLRQAGFAVVGAVENDASACATYRLNHPRVNVWEADIRRVRGTDVLKSLGVERGELDLLAACPPCQGFSSMRTRNGSRWNRDSRNDLIQEVARLMRALLPKCLMLENVPGLAKNGRFSAFVTALQRLGYIVKWDILNVADFGVPQNRRRLVVLASRIGEPIFAEPVGKKRTVRQAIGRLGSPLASRDPLHNYCVVRSPKVMSIVKQIPKDGGSRKDLKQNQQLKCHQQFRGFWDVYGRMAWDKPSPTITGGCINPSKGRFLHPEQDRAITLREAALLQSFPRTYKFRMEKGHYPVALQIGNALPPEFIRRHAITLRRLLSA